MDLLRLFGQFPENQLLIYFPQVDLKCFNQSYTYLWLEFVCMIKFSCAICMYMMAP